MAVQNIGTLVPTKIPSLVDDANIQNALKAYHYGSYDFDTAESDPAQLLNPSIAYTINNLQEQLSDNADLEELSRDISRATDNAPVAEDFAAFSDAIPNGYIWLDTDSSAGVGYYGATSIYTSSAPTTNLVNGLLWVEKGTSPLKMYIYNGDTSTWDEIGV